MRDNSKIWQLCLDTLEKQTLPEERKIDKVIMESVFRNAQIASINNNKVTITTPFSFNVETIKIILAISKIFFQVCLHHKLLLKY